MIYKLLDTMTVWQYGKLINELMDRHIRLPVIMPAHDNSIYIRTDSPIPEDIIEAGHPFIQEVMI